MNEVSSFETSQGSVYTYDSSGRVLRQKSALGSTMKASTSSFDRTVFVSPEDASAVKIGYERGLGPLEDGTLQGLDYNRDKLDNVKFGGLRKQGVSFDEAYTSSGGTITPRNITPELQPKIGYNPFEYNLKDNKYHAGNEVTKITPITEPVTKRIDTTPPKSATVVDSTKPLGVGTPTDLPTKAKPIVPKANESVTATRATVETSPPGPRSTSGVVKDAIDKTKSSSTTRKLSESLDAAKNAVKGKSNSRNLLLAGAASIVGVGLYKRDRETRIEPDEQYY